MHEKKHLGFTELKAAMADCFRQIHDPRQAGKVDHCMHDVLMSGFAMMFFQDPSILAFQTRLQESSQKNNLSGVFGVGSIPKDTQMRDIIDIVPTEAFSHIFPEFLNRLQRGRQLEQYRFMEEKYLIPFDGTQYFSSANVSCPYCPFRPMGIERAVMRFVFNVSGAMRQISGINRLAAQTGEKLFRFFPVTLRYKASGQRSILSSQTSSPNEPILTIFISLLLDFIACKIL
jgi:hypothetical protein